MTKEKVRQMLQWAVSKQAGRCEFTDLQDAVSHSEAIGRCFDTFATFGVEDIPTYMRSVTA